MFTLGRRKSNARRDPAPSRWGYRFHRIMLTPFYRQIMFVGLPVALIVGLVATFVLEPSRQAAIAGWLDAQKVRFQSRPEFMVEDLDITGADELLAVDIHEILQLDLPASSFDLDLEDMRQIVEAIPRVEQAAVRVRAGGVLEVIVARREPVAIWRTETGLRLLDGSGVYVGPLALRTDRSDLPVIAGIGAKDHLDEALLIFAAAEPIAERVRGLVRVGERRWDIVLDRDQRILLPRETPIAALERVIVLAETEDLLARDVAVVDVRNAQRPTVRLTQGAADALREIRLLETGNGSQ